MLKGFGLNRIQRYWLEQNPKRLVAMICACKFVKFMSKFNLFLSS